MNISSRKKALLARRAELVGAMTEIEHELDAPVTQDLEDYATERQADEVLEALGQVEKNEVIRINAALERIEAGTYGTCTVCGSEILEARLDLLPATPFCKACAV